MRIFSEISPLITDIPSPQNDQHTILSIVSGSALDPFDKLTDTELVKAAQQSLQDVFKEIEVPAPSEYFVSRWGKDEFAQMSYSYVQIGADGSDYDEMARPESERLMFAGEATNRHFPQTVTGAYLSGLREAARVFNIGRPKPEPANVKLTITQ